MIRPLRRRHRGAAVLLLAAIAVMLAHAVAFR